MNTEDQNLTAYALGELTGKEKADFEAKLKDNPELQAEVDAIREFTGEIESELKMEEEFVLDGSQRDKILNESRKKNFKVLPIIITAAAACLAVGYFISTKNGNLDLMAVSDKKAEYKDAVKQKSMKGIAEGRVSNGPVDAKSDHIYDQTRGGRARSSVNSKTPAFPLETKGEEFTDDDFAKFEFSVQEKERRLVEEARKMAEMKRVKIDSVAKKQKVVKEVLPSTDALEGMSERDLNLTGRAAIRKPVEGNTERYGEYVENAFGLVKESPLTTFSIDVDTASYTNLRRKLMSGYLPNKNAVRIEEMINYFDYDYPQPEAGRPFSVNTEVAQSPWSEGNKLVSIGLQGKEVKVEKRPSSNLVFLIDVSGSMSSSDKLPLLKEGFQKMVSQLNEKDRVGIVVYAGNAGVVLDPTICDQRGKDLIIGALGRLNAGGSTNGAGGINEAYRLVQKNFIQGGTNRVILATDGDFNVGVSHDQGLIGLVKEKAKEKAYLTVLGFGQGNLNDRMMEEISNKGNGNYFYIDSAKESTKVLCEKISSTLVTIAKDVKIQVEFNPALVHSYRLIGYDNRKLNNEDFNDDKKDAGEIGAGHNVTAIYEIVPVGSANARPKVDDLKYQPVDKLEKPQEKVSAYGDELLTVKLRYKSPEGGPSVLMKHPVKNKTTEFNNASKDFIFASSVAAFGMLLKNSEYSGDATYANVEKWISTNKTTQSNESREELLNLVRLVKRLKHGE